MDLERYGGWVVCITGATGGVGKILVDHFLLNGAYVVGIGRRVDKRIHDKYLYITCDVTSSTEMKLAFSVIKKKFGSLHVLINNAGVAYSAPFILLPTKSTEDMLNVNVLGAIIASREAASIMIKGRFGRVINIGSISASLEPYGASVYSATKSAVKSLSNSLARELAPYNITSNTLSLAPYPSDMLNTLSNKEVEWYLDQLKIKRLATREDILNVIDFFCDKSSSFITAQDINLGGISS